MSQSVDNALCTYRALTGNIHEFVFHEGSRDAVKQWAFYIEQLQLAQHWYGTEHVRLLLDAREAINLPIRYLFEMLSDYNRAYPDLKPPRVTMAYLRSPDTAILDVFHMMAELFEPPLTVQFFTDEDKARTWLKA
jgi:hypothetical protein